MILNSNSIEDFRSKLLSEKNFKPDSDNFKQFHKIYEDKFNILIRIVNLFEEEIIEKIPELKTPEFEIKKNSQN